MKNKEIIEILKNIGLILEYKGENPFKARAYTNAARIIEEQNLNVNILHKDNKLHTIQGFGDAIVTKLSDLIANGKMSYYEKLLTEIPESFLDIAKINGIGPKKAKVLIEGLNINNLRDLENACFDNKLLTLKGFKAKLQEQILHYTQHRIAAQGKKSNEEVYEISKEFLHNIKLLKFVHQADITGAYRRFSEILSEINIVISTNNINELCDYLKATYKFENITDSLILINEYSFPIYLIICEPDEFVSVLHNTTGSVEYLTAFNNYIQSRGCRIEHNFIYKVEDKLKFHSEEELYSYFNLQYVPPELREFAFALDRSIAHQIPVLVKLSDLRGMLHIHSTWSDGKNSMYEMAMRTKRHGFSHVAFCDHSQIASYAGGLTLEKILGQHKEIDELNEQELGIKFIKGIEADILKDGALDYNEQILNMFQMVVASVHSNFNLSTDEQTNRLVYALRSPFTTILGHPSGRLLLTRPAYQVDLKAVVDAAAENNKAIEINSSPYRLDLPWQWVSYAKDKGVKLAIDPDAHTVEDLANIVFGVKVARKGWLEAKDVVNCMEYDDYVDYIKRK